MVRKIPITALKLPKLVPSKEAIKLKKDLKKYLATQKALIKAFSKVITNKKIPLRERWDTFIEADDSLKVHETYIHTAKGSPIAESFNQWIRDFDYRRGNFDVASMLEDYAWAYFEGEESFKDLAGEYDRGFSYKEMPQVLEYILKTRLNTFEWDW